MHFYALMKKKMASGKQALLLFVSLLLVGLGLTKPIEEIGYKLVCPDQEGECFVTGTQEISEDQLVGGDMIRFKEEIEGSEGRNALISPARRWPNKTVPYVYHSKFTAKQKAQIEKAMRFLESKTCVKFVPYKKKQHGKVVLYFTNGKGCRATTGYLKNSHHMLNLHPGGCYAHDGTIQHEMLHVLGLKHEHSRPDRDQYVTIIMENVIPGQEHNFKKGDPSEYTTFGMTYDYSSVLHYPAVSFSKDGESPTIVPKKEGAEAEMGQRVKATDQDLKKIRLMYKCD